MFCSPPHPQPYVGARPANARLDTSNNNPTCSCIRLPLPPQSTAALLNRADDDDEEEDKVEVRWAGLAV